MLNLKSILVATDFSSGARRAVWRAGGLAARVGADLHLLHVVPSFDYNPIHALQNALSRYRSEGGSVEQDVADHLEEERRQLVPRSLSVHLEQRSAADVGAEILQYAAEAEVQLVVLGSGGERRILQPGIGATAERIAREAEVPVLLVRAASGEREKLESTVPADFRHLLLPVDFSTYSEKVVPAARALAGALDARLSLLYVAERRNVPVFSDTGLFTVNTLEPDPEITDRAAAALSQLYESSAGPAVDREFHVRRGHPAEAIAEYAENESVDMVVIPTHGMTGKSFFATGSVTDAVMHRASCPVLVLKPFGGSLV